MWRGNSWFRSSFSVAIAGALASAVACGEDESSGDSNKGGSSTGGAAGSSSGTSGSGGNVTGGAAGSSTGGNVTGGAAGRAGASGSSGSAGEGGAGMGGEGGEPMGGEGGEPTGGTAGSSMGGAGMGGTAGVGGAGMGGKAGAGAGGVGGAGAGGGGVGGAGAGGAGAGGAGAGGAGAGGGGMGGMGGMPPMAPNLYFSEYVEGDTIADAFEIYNASGSTVNLTGCEIRVHYAAAAASTPFALSGMLASEDVLVLCLARIHSACVVTTGLTDLSGDDSVELVCPVGGTMTTLDIIGQYGANLDPGQQWGGTGMDPGTQNATLRRRCSVMSGDRNATNAFDPDVWRGFDADNVSGLGARTCPCPTQDLTCP